MPRFITVGAAQMGPVGRNESRSVVVVRLMELMREAKSRGCDLVVFTECALTPFFPRWWEEDPAACDAWFERELPGPGTHMLFHEAKKLGIAFHLGFAELAEENGELRRYNSSVLVGAEGQIIGKYRKIHLPGLSEREGDNPHRCYEKHYFEVGNLGFGAWRALGGVVGMCLGNDRRWPESYRMLALQGAEIILIGYNTAADHPQHPELDHLTNFHSLLAMQAGAYQNGCFIIGVAKAGEQEGIKQIGRSAIIAPSGEVVTQCTSLGDELIVHRCDLDQTRLYKEHIFHFAAHREIASYSLLTETRGPIPPREPGEWGRRPATPPPVAKEAKEIAPDEKPLPASIEEVFTEEYGYSTDQAQTLAKLAKRAGDLSEVSPGQPPAEAEAPDPIQAVRNVLGEKYGYAAEAIDKIALQAVRALELKSQESVPAGEPAAGPSPPKKSAAVAKLLAKARAKSPPAATAESKTPPPVAPAVMPTAAEEIRWSPGRFSQEAGVPDSRTAIVRRLMRDYRYSEEVALRYAEQAERAWKIMHPAPEPPPTEAAPPEVFIPAAHPALAQAGEKDRAPLTQHLGPQTQTTPALSGEEALATYSLLTEKYGYSSHAARAVAERAGIAWRRWQESTAEATDKPGRPHGTAPAVPASAQPEKISAAVEPAGSPPGDEVVVVPCPECGFALKILRSNLSLLGRKARCPQCQTKFRLPEAVE